LPPVVLGCTIIPVPRLVVTDLVVFCAIAGHCTVPLCC
jgi:hypothetical protein